MYDFTEKRVVVTGGNSGIGKTIARRFVEAGAKVLICARSEDSLKTAAEEIGAAYHVCDISDWQSTKDLADAAVEKLGGVDIGVNSAGIEEKFMLKEHPPGHLEKMVAIQFTGAVYFMQHISNVMSGGGAIVNISSLTGTIAAPGYIAYSGAKAGVNHTSQVAAVELAGRGIRVNVVSPTVIKTPMVEKKFDVPGFLPALLEEHPLGDLPSPDDVADAVLWLSSDQSRFVTGETIHVDSGARQGRLPRPSDIVRHAKAAG